MKKYQQGDVLFLEVPKGKWYFKQDGNKEVMIPITEGKNYGSYGHKRESQSTNKCDVLTVAHGEATGHSHAFRMSQQISNVVTVISFGGNRTRVGEVPEFVKITNGSAIITHEEHNPLTIPAGHYSVSIVREFDHISGTARFVVD
jgi:uncharacterized cupin superfamily protein|tara:strand:+ start:404 stop:838 length:435 start_codon:yes stop_codon:yes gene_type:complete